MENLYEFKKVGYKTTKYKDYCEISEEDLLGKHSSDPYNDFLVNPINLFRQEFQYLSSHNDYETYQENLKNIFSYVGLQRLIVVVQKDNNKVSLKTFIYELHREHGKKYFQKTTICKYITYNFVENNLYVGWLQNYHKKKKCQKNFNKNNWYNIPIRNLSAIISSHLKNLRGNDFDDLMNSQLSVNQAFELFLSNIPGTDNNIKNLDDRLYKIFLDNRNIKLPNNWSVFNRTYPQIKIKDFKKNKLKFVDTFMNFHSLKGDKIKRVLHIVNTTAGIDTLKFALKLFGEDFILSQNDNVIKEIIESNRLEEVEFINVYGNFVPEDYTKNEIKNCFQIFKLNLNGEVNFYSFADHIKYKRKLKNFEPVIWKSSTYDKFIEEHYLWSEKVGALNDAQYNRKYNKEFKEFIEQPINDYYPILLSTSKEYNMESFVQNNCVRNYPNKPGSFIISIRKGDRDNKERATIEYQINNLGKTNKDNIIYEDYLVFNRVQSLGGYNKKLDEDWNEILEILDERMKISLENGVFILPEVEIKYGNKTYMSDLIFVEKKEFFLKPHQRTDYFTQKQLVFGNENIPKPNREVNLDVIFNEHIPSLNPINNDDLFF
jgi:Ca2+-binding EF-hand superfamily protein